MRVNVRLSYQPSPLFPPIFFTNSKEEPACSRIVLQGFLLSTMLCRTHPLHPVVRPGRVLQVQQDPVEGPGEGQVHGGVVGGVTLQRHILPLVDVGIGRSQCDLSGICIQNNASSDS